MMRNRYASLLLAVLAAAHFGCGGCGKEDDPEGVAPEITSEPGTIAVVGEEYRYFVTVTGEPEPTVTATGADGGELPGWLAFDADTLTLLGLPPESQVGVHEVVITASNGIEPDAVQAFEITVQIGGVAPVFTTEPITEAFTGEEYIYVVEASGIPEPDFQASNDEGGELAGWLAFDDESGTLSGTPDLDDIGDHAVVITASNDVEPDAVQSFTITVTRSNQTPLITSDPVTEVMEGELYSYQVVATGYPEPVIAAGGSEGADLPEWLTMEDGLLSGTPGADDVGEHGIVIAATNVVGTDTQAFTIVVERAPFAPTITSTPETDAVVGTEYSYEVIAIGHPEPVLTAPTLPAWLSFDAGTGILSGTPGAEDLGDAPVEITATNDEGVDTQSFTITVTPALEAPVITSTPVTEAEANLEYSYQVTATGYPAPTFAFSGADWLSIDESTGLLTGTPGFADVGEHAVQVMATNSEGSDTQSFDITVTADDTAPSFTSTPALTAYASEEYVYEIQADGYPLPTLAVTGLPAWLTFDGVATISGTPDIFDLGVTGDITVTAANGVAPDAEQVFMVTVEPAPGIDLSAGLFHEGFGTELPAGWSVFGEWEFGAPIMGPASAYEGDYLAGTVLAGYYTGPRLSSLATPVLDFTDVDDAGMRFAHWYRTEGATWDGGNVKISVDGGATFSVLVAGSVAPAYTGTLSTGYENPLGGQQAWGGTSAGWILVDIDLEANLDGADRDQVVLRFDFGADADDSPHEGWYVDDVMIGDTTLMPTAPTITSVPDTMIGVGQTYSYTVEAEGLPAPGLAASGPEDADLPTWLTFDSVTGVLSGAPAAADLGDHEVVITATNGIAPDAEQSFTITVLADPVSAPEITSTPDTTAEVGVEYSYTVVVTGSPEPAVTVSGLPFWLAFDSETGVISGTPLIFDVGETGDITVTATNGVNPHDEQVFTITVAAPDPIEIAGAPLYETFGEELPSGWSAFGSWQFGVPTSGPNGAFVGDHVAATILAGNYPNNDYSVLATPVLDLTGVVDAELRFHHWYDIEAEYDGGRLLISVDGGETWDSIIEDSIHPESSRYDRIISGQRWWSLSNAAAGWHEVIVDLDTNLDGLDRDQVVIAFEFFSDAVFNYDGWYLDNVKIGAADELPLAPSITSTPATLLGVGQSYSYTVEAEGNPEPTLTASGAGGEDLAGWLAFDSVTGELSGEPLAADVGDHVVEIVASNGVSPDAMQTFTITVLEDPVVAPEITSTPATTVQIDELYSYEILVTGSPEPAISVMGLPSWLSFDTATNTISGTPVRFQEGSYPITVRAVNGADPDAEQVFTITVLAPEAIELAGDPLHESFGEEIPAGWFATGDWEFGTPTVGPTEAFEGDHVAATRLSANYTDSILSSLYTPELDLTDIDDPVLRFAHYYHTETDNYDGGNVKISWDGGQTFQQLIPATVVPAYTGALTAWGNPIGGQLAWYGNSNGWLNVEVDLGENLDGQPIDQVVLRFDFGADGSVNHPGWYLDAVQIGSALELDLVEVAFFDFGPDTDNQTNEASFVADGFTVTPFVDARDTWEFFAGIPGRAISASEWDEDDNYFEFAVIPEEGVDLHAYQLHFDDRATSTGPTSWELLIVDSEGDEISVATGDTSPTGDWNVNNSPMNVVTFEAPNDGPFTSEDVLTVRIRAYGATASSGNWRIDNVGLLGFVDIIE